MKDTNESINSITTQIEIVTLGDTILVVGPYNKKIRVCSSVLKSASKYFRVLFGPNFAEGQDLDSNNPKEVSMPDDNAHALEIICNVIHLRNDAVPRSLSPKDIFEIAIAADKFDCVVALKYAGAIWLNPKGVENILELSYLMSAAYIFDDAQAFGDITLSMMLNHKDSYLPLADQGAGITDGVPWKVLCKYQVCQRLQGLR
jgi:hypothetical protein